jgi:hypothetical protein
MTKYGLIKLESRDCFLPGFFLLLACKVSGMLLSQEATHLGQVTVGGFKGWRQGKTYHVMRIKIQMRTVHLAFVIVCMVYKYRHIFMSRLVVFRLMKM